MARIRTRVTRGGATATEAGAGKKSELDSVIAAVSKQYGGHVVKQANGIVQPDRISTGVFLLDFALLGGIPVSRGTMLIGKKHSGKCGRNTDRILTPYGYVTYGEVKVGDLVIGSDGKATPVIGVFPRGLQPMYTVTFTDGCSVIVGADHLWAVQTTKQAHSTGHRLVVSTEDLAGVELKNVGYKYRIPVVKPVEFAPNTIGLDPYLLGVLLANGHLRYPQFTTNDLSVVEHIRYRCPTFVVTEHGHGLGNARRWYVSDGSYIGVSNNRTIDFLRDSGLYGVTSLFKFVPREFLFSSVENRLALLQGLMDCDGTTGLNKAGSKHHKGAAKYCTRSAQLAKDVQHLVQSLGGLASIVRSVHPRDGGVDYTVMITLPKGVVPFVACQEKVRRYVSRGHRNPVRSIVSVTPWGVAESTCIAVAAPDSLYVAEDFIVTHNTSLACLIIASVQKQFPDKRAVVVDIEGTFDVVWAEKLGVDVNSLYLVHPESGEAAADIVDVLMRTWEVSLVVVDSVAALVPMKEIESSAEDAHVGLQARLMGALLRKTTSSMISERSRGHFVTPLYINQYRAKIGGMGGFGEQFTTPGGMALGFANSVEIIIRNWEKTKTVNGVDRLSHNEHTFKIEKNKLNAGIRSGEFKLLRAMDETYGLPEGTIDDGATMIAFASKFGAYARSGKGYLLSFWGEEVSVSSVDDAVRTIYQDGDLYAKLRDFLIWTNAKDCGMPEYFLSRFTDPYDL